MSQNDRPWRSVLYIPGSNARALEKAKALPADAIIFDLEDAVAPNEKPAARDLLAETLADGGYGARACLIRVNGLDTPWGTEDLKMASSVAPEGVLLTKVESPAMAAAAAAHLPDGQALWAMMETPAGILNASEIARAPGMVGFVIGTNDLAKDIGCDTGGDRMPMMTSLQTCVLAARAAGIICIDGVYNAFRDEDGLAAECAQGRSLGMDGKSLIHPSQIAVANDAFAPVEAEIELAMRQIQAHEAAIAAGQGVAVLDGKIVENLHVEAARAILAKAAAIAAIEEAI